MEYGQQDAQIALDIIGRSPSLAIRMRPDGGYWRTLFVNDSISHYGYSREEFMRGDTLWENLVHPLDLPLVSSEWARHKEEGAEQYTTYYRTITKSHGIRWVMDNCTVTRDARGETLYIDCIISDHTELIENRDKLNDSLARQQLLNEMLRLTHASEPDDAFKIILERAGDYLGVSRAVLFEDDAEHRRFHPVQEWSFKGVPPLVGARAQQQSYDAVPDLARQLDDKGFCAYNYGEMPGDSPLLDERGVLALAAYAVYQGNERYGFISFDDYGEERRWDEDTLTFLSNVAQLISTELVRKENEASIRHMAYHDQLTGLINRYRYDQYLGEAIYQAKRVNKDGYVLFIDMDDFKVINEGYGHGYGDALLITVANFLKERFTGRARLFRFGGDEFTLLVEHEQAAGVQDIIDELLNRSRHPWKVMDREFYCTVSVGVVRFPDGGTSATNVTKNADIAMYKAKNRGKNNYVLYNESMDNESVQRAELEHRMREAIENEFAGFRVYYQPIVNLNGDIIGAEALIRWTDAAGNMTPPDKFIPLAEYLGLIVPLGTFVLQQSALFCKQMNEYFPDFRVNVNISIRQFQQSNFLATVEQVLQAAELDYSSIVLEVTEGMLIQDIEHMQLMAEQLRGMGIKIAMDDFGTGYSSLNNMRQLPLDIIKIDRTFIRDVTTDAYSKSFIRLISDLVHSMGRTVCVEGVETAAQYRYCAECHVDTIQGYYFHKPMPATQLRKLLLGDKRP